MQADAANQSACESHPQTIDAKFVISAVEVREEIVQDLLQADNRNLEVCYTSDFGPAVEGAATREYIPSQEQTALNTTNLAFDARTDRVSERGKTSDDAATLYNIDLSWSRFDEELQEKDMMFSRFTLVELPGTEKLTDERTVVHKKDGGSALSNAIFTFRDICRLLKKKDPRDFVTLRKFRESKVTYLLSEILTGNFVCEFLGFVRGGGASMCRTGQEEDLSRLR